MEATKTRLVGRVTNETAPECSQLELEVEVDALRDEQLFDGGEG
jgi:hypothetical protein